MKAILVVGVAAGLAACANEASLPAGPSAIGNRLETSRLSQSLNISMPVSNRTTGNGAVEWGSMTAAVTTSGAPARSAAGSGLRAFTMGASAFTVSAPLNLSALVSVSNVTLSWTTGAEPIESYVVEAGSRPGVSDLAVFDTGNALNSLLVTNVPAGSYYVRVRARQGTAVSNPSNEINVLVGSQVSGFTIELPIRLGDSANNAYGLLPFGVHIGDHGIDGHPGWDLEFVPGATVYAAATGTVQSVLPSGNGVGFGIQLQHTSGPHTYRTIYGVGSLAPGVYAGASITVGQALGATDIFTRTIGRTTVTYSMTHFQVDDFSRHAGLTNHHAVPPERFLSAAAQQTVAHIWRSARYTQEIVEPFLANSRDAVFPATRVWTLVNGTLAARMEITAASASSMGYTYAFRSADGTMLETGTVEVDAAARPLSAIDFRPTGSSSTRRGVYSIVDDEMQLDYAAPGASRPVSLAGASTYRTQ